MWSQILTSTQLLLYSCAIYTVIQSQKAVSDYLQTEQILPFGLAEQFKANTYTRNAGYMYYEFLPIRLY